MLRYWVVREEDCGRKVILRSGDAEGGEGIDYLAEFKVLPEERAMLILKTCSCPAEENGPGTLCHIPEKIMRVLYGAALNFFKSRKFRVDSVFIKTGRGWHE